MSLSLRNKNLMVKRNYPSRQELLDTILQLKKEKKILLRDKSPRVTTEQYKFKVALEKILEYLHKWHKWDYHFVECDDSITIKGKLLEDFQKYICKELDILDKRHNMPPSM